MGRRSRLGVGERAPGAEGIGRAIGHRVTRKGRERAGAERKEWARRNGSDQGRGLLGAKATTTRNGGDGEGREGARGQRAEGAEVFYLKICFGGFCRAALRQRSASSAGSERQSELSDERKARSDPGEEWEAEERRATQRGRSTRRRSAADEAPSPLLRRAQSEPTSGARQTSETSFRKAGSAGIVADEPAREWGRW